MYSKRELCLVVLIGMTSACAGDGEPNGAADLILRNGNVITMEGRRPRAEALAIRGNRILAVGTNEEVDALAGGDTKILDLRGQTAVPGLIDAHMHFSRLGKRTKQLFLDATESPEQAIEIVRERVHEAEPGQWITGDGWHTVYWDAAEYPTNRALNEIAPENPVYLVGMASHAAWVNDKALELAGIDETTPDPPGGQILKDPLTGEPSGILLETAADIVAAAIPPDTRESKKADIRLSVEKAASMGLTEVHDAGVGYEEIDIYKELLDEGALDIRLYVMFLIPDAGEVLDEYISRPPEIGLGDGRLTLRALKAFADGALGARGAALLEPYSDRPGEVGLIPNPPAVIEEMVHKAMKAGYQIAIHAIGDRGNRVVLDAVQKAQSELGIEDGRARIEHAQVLSSTDIPRFAGLGVIASMQPIHATMDMGFAESRLGPERVRGAYAWRSLIDSGAVVAAGADTPSFPVDYTNPLWGIYAAVTRQDGEGKPAGGWYPDQRVSRMEALKMYTVDAAYAAFEEDMKGTLSPGKLADVTVLSKDVLTVPEAEILDTEATMTVVAGEIIYEK